MGSENAPFNPFGIIRISLKIYNSHFKSLLQFQENLLKSDSYLLKKCVYLLQWKSLKNDKKLFLFHVNRFLFLRYINFCPAFLVMWENIRKLRLISKLMTSQPGKQTISMHILPNISIGNTTTKFDHLIEFNVRNNFKNHAKNEERRIVPDPFYFLKKLHIK